jgi:hypothetical protein
VFRPVLHYEVQVDEFFIEIGDNCPGYPVLVCKTGKECATSDKWLKIGIPPVGKPGIDLLEELPFSPGPFDERRFHVLQFCPQSLKILPAAPTKPVHCYEILIYFVNASFVREAWRITGYRK